MNVTIGILAHVDAGKTTLSEQILYRCGALRSCGRVDHGDACLDFTAVERGRGITVFSAQAGFCHGSNSYFLLDTPGHTDFSPEMERCLAALDYAILVISATAGVQAHTETLWRLLRERKIPVICFLNKLDAPGADREAALRQMGSKLGGEFLWLPGGLTEEIREQVAMTDDGALEAYLGGNWTDDACMDALAKAVADRKLFPVYGGSALTGDGVDELLDGMDHICRTQYDEHGPLRVRAYQVRRDRQGNRVTFLKVLSGILEPRQLLGGEKVHELRRYFGEKWTPLERAGAGELAAATGLKELRAGDAAGVEREPGPAAQTPPLRAQVLCGPEVPPTKLLSCFRQLEEEEPSLAVEWQESLKALHVAVMGEIQLEVLQQTVEERFGFPITFGPCQVAYQETILRPVRGCGHFEPLRHYAEVHLLLEPAERGSGVTFVSRCSTDDLALNWQRLIETHVLERKHPGALAGMPLTDVRVVLLAGRAHDKHTEGGDFRQATYRAIRQALFSGESILLEPCYRFTMEVEPPVAGKILSDMAMLHGQCQPPETVEGATRLTGTCPVATMLDYARGFAAMTRGRGSLRLEMEGYAPCHDQEAVVERIGYDRERDAENPAGSVFCDHGAGHPVDWREAPAMMHIRLD